MNPLNTSLNAPPTALSTPAVERLRAQIQEAQSAQKAQKAVAAGPTRLRIQGHGSKTALHRLHVPLAADAQTLDTTALTGISAYEPSELVVTVRAGTPLAELEAALAERGQFLAFEPPRFDGRGTVGGMVAAGLAGPARQSVGTVRDYVLGATLLNGRGELLSFGGQVMKNVAGYDVSRLLAGSWGSLGVLCEVSLKVLPQPLASQTLRFALSQVEALALLLRWSRQPLPLNASAWHDGTLWLRLSGARAAVASAQHSLCAEAGGTTVDPVAAAALWTALRDGGTGHPLLGGARVALPGASPVPVGQRLWRLAVPPQTPTLRLPGTWLVEWHGGLRWLLTDAAPQAVHDAVHAVGGHVQCLSAGGELPPAWQATALSAPLERLNRQVRAAFDPHGLFHHAH